MNNTEIQNGFPKQSESYENSIQTQVMEIISQEEEPSILFNKPLK